MFLIAELLDAGQVRGGTHVRSGRAEPIRQEHSDAPDHEALPALGTVLLACAPAVDS
jgi:hypothetical protein